MKLVTTEPRGNRILYVIPDENNLPQFSCWYLKAEKLELIFALLDAENIDVRYMNKADDRNYMVCQKRDHPENGAVVIKYTREGEAEDQDYVLHDIVFGEDLSVAMDIMIKYYKG